MLRGYLGFLYFEAFSFLNESRKTQLVELMKESGNLPIYYPDDAEVLLKAGQTKDGKLLCAVVDVSLDPIEEFPLVIKREVSSVKKLMANGEYEKVDFTRNGDTYTLSVTANVFDPLILIIE